MPRLESMFSVQVKQPYLVNPFPIRIIDPHEDRIRKHLTFLTDEQELTLRVRTIDNNQMVSSVVTQKRVPTRILVNDIHEEVFRVKAVLSKEDHGVKESYWLTKKSVEEKRASTHNQFRIRGVSKENWRGDWVYSELRDFDNDLIVYNMLYDMLDIMLSVHDGEIDYLMDYVLSDTFIKVIQESIPEFSTTLDPDEIRQVGIAEWLSVLVKQVDKHPQEDFVSKLSENFLALSNEMKKEFNENVMSSPKEFYQVYKAYSIFDQHIQTKNDFAQMLVEYFLEERFDKIVQKTDIEVFLKNEEETGIYLKGTYKLDIKKELVTALSNASPVDHFVTCLNDAVQLLSEPVVYDTLVYDKNEEIEKFLRLAISELFVPFVATDVHLLEIEHELMDKQDIDSISTLMEFMLFNDDAEARFFMIYDVIELLIKSDLDLKVDFESVIVDRILQMMNDSRKALLIDYEFGEFLEVFMNIGESFRQAYSRTFGTVVEDSQVSLIDKSKLSVLKNAELIGDNQNVQLIDKSKLNTLKGAELVNDNQKIEIFDKSKLATLKRAKLIDDNQSVQLVDKSKLSPLKRVELVDDNQKVQLIDKSEAMLLKKEGLFSEIEHTSLIDVVLQDYLTFKSSLNERISSLIHDAILYRNKDTFDSVEEPIYMELKNDIVLHSTKDAKFIGDKLSVEYLESTNLLDILTYLVKSEISIVSLQDKVKNLSLKLLAQWSESIMAEQHDMYHILYKLHLREPNRYPLLENLDIKLSHSLRDLFIIDGHDIAQYALGKMDDGWPVGTFRLGVNTIKSEV